MTTSPNSKDFPPSVLLGLLYEKVSAKGKRYFAGRLGAAKIAVVPAREPAEDGTPIWRILVSEAPPKQDSHVKSPASGNGTPRRHSDVGVDPRAKGGFDRELDDEIPF